MFGHAKETSKKEVSFTHLKTYVIIDSMKRMSQIAYSKNPRSNFGVLLYIINKPVNMSESSKFPNF